jgi:hypothetical protein
MSSIPSRLAAGLLALCLGMAFPSSAEAIPGGGIDISGSPEGKSYFTFVFFADFLNGDCFKFNSDESFVASYGLLIGEWSEESVGILFFSFTWYEVAFDSPENPLFTLIALMDGKVILGKIDTDDGDSGFFLGIESQICEYPARVPGKKAKRTAADAEPACCGMALDKLFAPADAAQPANLLR